MIMDCIESASVEFEDPNSSVDVDRLLHMSELTFLIPVRFSFT